MVAPLAALKPVQTLQRRWPALLGAVVSDLALALRNVLSKQAMDKSAEERGYELSPANMFGVLTCVSALLSAPVALTSAPKRLSGVCSSACGVSNSATVPPFMTQIRS